MRATHWCETKPARWALLAAAAAMLLAGCGGGGDGTSGTATPVNPSTPTVPGAPTATGDTATDGFAWFNFRRTQIGLSALARNAKIDAAAAAHSNYLRANSTVSHDEINGNPGFTGATLGNRLAAAGYTIGGQYAYGEVISAASDRAGFFHAEELIAAIYHRFVVFEPVFRDMGVGAATNASGNYTYFTADLAATGSYGPGLGAGRVAVYPADNQTAVPVNFMSDSESPDPVPNQNEVGYPISVHADISSSITVSSFTVKPRGGSNLAVRLLAKSVDPETPLSAAAIIPLSRLAPATTYDVSFTGTAGGAAVSRTWSFTTK